MFGLSDVVRVLCTCIFSTRGCLYTCTRLIIFWFEFLICFSASLASFLIKSVVRAGLFLSGVGTRRFFFCHVIRRTSKTQERQSSLTHLKK
jgi:hypothetical protein